jgi:hypothetical protein
MYEGISENMMGWNQSHKEIIPMPGQTGETRRVAKQELKKAQGDDTSGNSERPDAEPRGEPLQHTTGASLRE